MAELNVGKHCEVKSCKLLDFLPFNCPGCSSIFCKDHEKPEKHNCSECNLNQERAEYEGPKSYKCSLEACSIRELTPVVCPACNKSFCLQHRHQVDHNCEKYEAPQPKMTQTAQHVQDILDKRKDAPTKKTGKLRKSKATAAKVALMKIKMKAVGDKGVPVTERIHLLVLLPTGQAEKTKPCFFSKKWSIGKIIDDIAGFAKLQNNNNVAGAKKLRLFDPDTGGIYATEASLDSLLGDSEGQICNGANVIIEYVTDDTTQLTDVEKYAP